MTSSADKSYRPDDFFTKPEIISECVADIHQVILPHIEVSDKPHLFVIDSSAGSNQFCRELQLPHYANDLFRYPETQGQVHHGDWLEIKRESIPINRKTTQVAIGFNPPFGPRYKLIHDFVDHAVREFQPEWFFWLIPVYYRMKPEHERWYEVVLTRKLDGNIFYRPRTGQDQGGVLCEFRVYKRRESPVEADSSIMTSQNVMPKEHSLVQIFKPKAILDGKISLANLDPEKILLIRCVGRGSGRKFMEPQGDGISLFHYKDKDSAPVDQLTWDEFFQNYSPATFYMFLFQMPLNRTLFRHQWIDEWRQMAPHSFDPRNSVCMNLYKKEHCIPILFKILNHSQI